MRVSTVFTLMPETKSSLLLSLRASLRGNTLLEICSPDIRMSAGYQPDFERGILTDSKRKLT